VNAAPPALWGTPRRFVPRPVGLDQFPSLLRETAALVRAAPGRLCALFLLVFLPVQILPGVPYIGMPLRETLASIGFAGFFVALEVVRQGRRPTLLDMAYSWRLPGDKLILLVASGLLPLLAVLLVWWLDIGATELDAYLSGHAPEGSLPVRQQLEFVLVFNLVGMPLLFIQPLSVLCSWSATRTLSANLLVWIANWRWALIITLVLIPVAIGLESFDPASALEVALSLISEVAVEIGLSAFTLVLLQRTLQ